MPLKTKSGNNTFIYLSIFYLSIFYFLFFLLPDHLTLLLLLAFMRVQHTIFNTYIRMNVEAQMYFIMWKCTKIIFISLVGGFCFVCFAIWFNIEVKSEQIACVQTHPDDLKYVRANTVSVQLKVQARQQETSKAICRIPVANGSKREQIDFGVRCRTSDTTHNNFLCRCGAMITKWSRKHILCGAESLVEHTKYKACRRFGLSLALCPACRLAFAGCEGTSSSRQSIPL